MAVLGFQLVLTLIGGTIIQKILPRFSPARWFLVGLHRYVHPTNQELRECCYPESKSGRKRAQTRHRNHDEQEKETFDIPKDVSIALETVKIGAMDLFSVPYYVEFVWCINLFFVALFVCAATEIYSLCLPIQASRDINLSVVWCFLVAGVALKSLAAVAALYFRRESADTGERSLCLCCGALFFLVTMVLFVFSEKVIDLNLLKSYHAFINNSAEYLKSQEIDMSSNRNPILMFLVLSIYFGVIAGLLAFPALRFARIFIDASETAGRFERLLLSINFFLPLLSSLLWINPVSKDHLTTGESAVLSGIQLESLRLWASVAFVLSRFLIFRPCLQVHLNSAEQKILDMRKEGGKITNQDFQRMIARVYWYLCIVAIQLISPAVLIGCLTLLLKILGDYSWLSLFGIYLGSYRGAPISSPSLAGDAASRLPYAKDVGVYLAKLTNVFTPDVHRGVWSLMVFWTSVLQFSLSAIGVAYYSTMGKEKL